MNLFKENYLAPIIWKSSLVFVSKNLLEGEREVETMKYPSCFITFQPAEEHKAGALFLNLTADEVFLTINFEISVTMEQKQRLVDYVTKLVNGIVCVCVCR